MSKPPISLFGSEEAAAEKEKSCGVPISHFQLSNGFGGGEHLRAVSVPQVNQNSRTIIFTMEEPVFSSDRTANMEQSSFEYALDRNLKVFKINIVPDFLSVKQEKCNQNKKYGVCVGRNLAAVLVKDDSVGASIASHALPPLSVEQTPYLRCQGNDAMDVAYELDVKRVHQHVRKDYPERQQAKTLLVDAVSWKKELE
ncbi:hypothetical protein MJG53_019620 [Ovis ammon polii x Ovis aries]|uniref:Uncharacterized protein n=1 Tax=Ovis ammon polii x Ovis aries TaxID=2918886 RepID=A0ACB9U0D9_9CETA|nr:hypothetical protein MJG53_019620 [Ovis ammon polii x Ovis aries]